MATAKTVKFVGSGMLWDAKSDRPLVTFVGGVAEVSDKTKIDALKEAGYKEVKAEETEEE